MNQNHVHTQYLYAYQSGATSASFSSKGVLDHITFFVVEWQGCQKLFPKTIRLIETRFTGFILQ